MIILLLFAFISGITTILAPCIWPVLPLVLSFSIRGKSHLRPLGVTIGILLSFAVFTLAISTLVMVLHLDPNILRLIAVGFLIFFGISMIIPSFTYLIEAMASRLTQLFGGNLPHRNDFIGGFLSGISLGILWSPCAGPILATIAAVAIAGQVSTSAVLVTLSYIAGVGIPLFLFAYGGQRVFIKTRFFSPHTGKIQRLFGVLTILVALAILTNYDKIIQAKLLDLFPAYSALSTNIESNSQVTNQLNVLKGQTSTSQKSSSFGKAPEFTNPTQWLNVNKPLTLKDLRGKVVLIDFWTYTCINCIRTLPHVTAWYEKYKDKGFVVVGVHTPEFEFEKDTGNVKNAIAQFHITYPVVQDNNYGTWNAYSNQYWPAEYLIDSNGSIVDEHFGEGNYDQTEKKIQELLKEAGKKVDNSIVSMPDQTPTGELSPETYLGSNRAEFFYPNGYLPNGDQQFTLNPAIPINSFSLDGAWNITPENAITGKNAKLLYNFHAKKVFLVMRPGVNKSGKVRVLFNGKVVSNGIAGSDVKDGVVTIDSDRLYTLIEKNDSSDGYLQLEFLTPGIECFAFTFG